MSRSWIAPFQTFTLCFLFSVAASTQAPPADWLDASPHGPWVVSVELFDLSSVPDLDHHYDVWQIDPMERRVVMLIDKEELQKLLADGFEPSLDLPQTSQLQRLGIPLPGQSGGIPGFPCYRTVEETLASAEGLVAQFPDLGEWIDIGDSWAKTQDAQAGYDLRVLKLTQKSIPGPKPIFFATFAIHAREYTTAELGMRFAEFLTQGYGTNPDITWVLDHHEVHLLLQANPDGRKRAETGLFWRKNANNNYCGGSNSRGADLNRNFEFEWNCCGGSSGSPCNTTYRGPLAASEPEVQAVQNYARSIFPDQRGPGLDDPAPDDATGIAIDIHSSGQLVIWPWGFTSNAPPNGTAFRTLGRKLAFFNGHTPLQISEFAHADGDTASFFYGELGVAGLGYELGTQFFESCTFFESQIVPGNLQSLLYAAKVARTPYLTPAGPEATATVAAPSLVAAGDLVEITATLDDTRYSTANGTESSQTVVAAEAYVDVPPWGVGAVPIVMAAVDGTFDESIEEVRVTLDTTGWSAGRHRVFVRGLDGAGRWGAAQAVFVEVEDAIFTDGFESGDTSAWF